MRKTRIYLSATLDVDTTTVLDKAASHHLIRVLRMKTGAAINLFNNSGNEYECTLLDLSQSAAKVRVHSCQPCHTESKLQIHLLQGISRGDRMDLSIQKATELGVTKITPVMCERTNVSLSTERWHKKLEHWQQIIISACEQSGRCQLAELTDISQLSEATRDSVAATRLVLDPATSTSLGAINATHTIALLVGPEGGLTEHEVETAKQNGFSGVTLGPRVLRTETAGIASIAALQALWGDLS